MQVSRYESPTFSLPDAEVGRIGTLLHDDGLVLLPTEACWSITCMLCSPVATQRLYRLRREFRMPFAAEVLVSDLDMLRSFVPQLHPRLETLLAYHRRPLSIYIERHTGVPPILQDDQGRAIFRIAPDPLCRQLIESLNTPLATVFATLDPAKAFLEFGSISSSILERMDSVIGLERAQELQGIPVLIRLDEQEKEFIFLRE
jgi:L-threonylcarbamoyladenylate synthase